jgi:hydroxymethylglutaryl-CoA synthase
VLGPLKSKPGIVSYGAYVPRYRIAATEIARVWGHDAQMGRNLNVEEKSVPGPDEDVATMSVEASRTALARAELDPTRIGAIYVGSESHPYAVKPTGTILAEALGTGPDLTMADLEFACKAGTAAMQICMGLSASGMIDLGLAVGADTSQGAPSDALEYSASAGAASFLIGQDAKEHVAVLEHTASFTSDTPDFWRREGQRYPSHSERFTGRPAFFKHVAAAAHRLMKDVGTKPEDYAHVVFHQPNGKFPTNVGKQLGFTPAQMKTGLLAPRIGNTYSAASILGLAAILDIAKPDERILCVSYGSGAGSDAFDIRVTKGIDGLDRSKATKVETMIADRVPLDYALYAKFRGKISAPGGSS